MRSQHGNAPAGGSAGCFATSKIRVDINVNKIRGVTERKIPYEASMVNKISGEVLQGLDVQGRGS